MQWIDESGAPVTDPLLLKSLEGKTAPAPVAQSSLKWTDESGAPVTDPLLLQSLRGGRATPAPIATAQTFTAGPDGSLTPRTDAGAGGYTGAPTAFPGFQQGLGDPFVGAGQLAAHALSPIAPSLAPQMDEAVRQREADYQGNRGPEAPNAPYQSGVFNADAPGGPVYVPPASPTGATYGSASLDTGRMLGNIAGTAPISIAMPGSTAAAALPRIASAAASGGITSALNPIDRGDNASESDFWTQKAKEAAVGAALAGGLTAGGSALSSAVSPKINPNVRTLMDLGVNPTPGQIFGGSLGRIEEGLTSIPLVGDQIKNAQFGTVKEFNRGILNQALAPIGEKLEFGTPLGRQAIDETATKISNGYDAILPKLKPQADAPFLDNMETLAKLSRSMPADRSAQFQGILQNTVFDRMSPGGGMTGQGFKDADTQLGQMVRSYRNAQDPDIRQLGDGLLQAQVELRAMVRRSNPDLAPQLDANNKAYSLFLRAQTAAARQGAEEGVFTPAQYSSAVKQLDPTLRDSAYARGNAVGQDVSDAAKSVMGKKVPDSGTPFRTIMAAGGLGALGSTSPPAALAGGLGGLLAMAAYSNAGRGLLAKALTARPDWAPQLAGAIRGATPGAVTALVPRLLGQ